MRSITVLCGVFVTCFWGCGSDDEAGLFTPAGSGNTAGDMSGVGGDGGSETSGGTGGAMTGGAGGSLEGGAGGSLEGGVGGGLAGGGSGPTGGSGGSVGPGGSGGSAGTPITGGSGGGGSCVYGAHQAWSLDDLAEQVNLDVASGWAVHSFHAREENNSGSAEPNVVWLQKNGAYLAVQDFSLEDLATAVNALVAEGATVHTVLARPHGSSVPPEVAWLSFEGQLWAMDEWSLETMVSNVNTAVASGNTVYSFHAREENNSGGALPNVVWLKGGAGYVALQDMAVSALATKVTTAVGTGSQVISILARPHGSSVPTNVAWLEKGGTYRGHETWQLDALATQLNTDTADGWKVVSLHARPNNNGGSELPNVVWMQRESSFLGLQALHAEQVAELVNGVLATGWQVHTILARPHGSSVAPEVAWLIRCE